MMKSKTVLLLLRTAGFFSRTTFLDIFRLRHPESVRAGRSISYLTPDAVIAYIASKRLYGFSGNP
jgi:nicotinic acid mononucleotide adenylyltransferase